MSLAIGVIAEDKSDIDVMDEIIRKTSNGKLYHIKYFIGYGSGKIKSKCCAWAKSLHQQRCNNLILLHDLDEKNEITLKRELASSLATCEIVNKIVVIPVKEIEAWLLADHEAIRNALNLKLPIKKIANPEAINNPKEYLRDLVFLKSGKIKRYTNTLNNKQIASKVKLANLARCASFLPLKQFLSNAFR